MDGVTRKEWLILTCMICAMLMNGIDSSIVTVALPSIADYFGTGLNEVAWVTICYSMMMAGLLLPFGRLSDSGRIRDVFVVGFAVFTVSSLFCGISENFLMLLIFRVAQGAGAAMMGSTAPMICVKFMPSHALGLSLGVMTLAGATGYTVGPFIGGIITEISSWHWIFLVNIPIGVLTILFGLKVLPKEERVQKHLNLTDTAFLFAAVICMIIALERMSVPGFGTLCAVAGICAFACLGAFVALERRSESPILNLRMFRNWRLDAVIASWFLINLLYLGALYMMPFYLDGPMGMGSAMSGMVLLIPSLIALVMGIPVGKACDARGKRMFAIAASVFNVCYCAVFVFMRPEMGMLPVLAVVVFMGLVWGTCGASSSGRIVDNVPPGDKGMGSALMSFVNYTGSTAGTALFASLLSIGADAAGKSIDELSTEAFLSGLSFAGICATVLAVVSLACAVAVNEKKKGV